MAAASALLGGGGGGGGDGTEESDAPHEASRIAWVDGLGATWALLHACAIRIDGWQLVLEPQAAAARPFGTLVQHAANLVRPFRWAQSRSRRAADARWQRVMHGASSTLHQLLCIMDVVITSGGGDASGSSAEEAQEHVRVIEASNTLRECFEEEAASSDWQSHEEAADEASPISLSLSDGWGGAGASGGAGSWEEVDDDES